jgi:hypothetical protein
MRGGPKARPHRYPEWFFPALYHMHSSASGQIVTHALKRSTCPMRSSKSLGSSIALHCRGAEFFLDLSFQILGQQQMQLYTAPIFRVDANLIHGCRRILHLSAELGASAIQGVDNVHAGGESDLAKIRAGTIGPSLLPTPQGETIAFTGGLIGKNVTCMPGQTTNGKTCL